MKTLLATFALTLFAASLTAKAKRPSKITAHYLCGHAEQLVDSRVSVDVAFAQPLHLDLANKP